jgi:hypothetical protein
MKTLFTTLVLAFALQCSNGADFVTLTGSNTYTVGTNEVAEVVAVGSSLPTLSSFLLNGAAMATTKTTGTGGGIVSVLPVAITGSNTIAPGDISMFVSLRVRTKAEYLSSLTVPSQAISSAVVIPEDASGPVTIVMESSTDLVTWVAANPGTYGSSTPRRFFRVRALQN